MLHIGLIRNILSFFCILTCTMTLSALAETIHKSKILSHTIEIELFLKEHKLKAIDHMLVTSGNVEIVSCFINTSFKVLSVSSSQRKLDYSAGSEMPRGDFRIENFRRGQHLEIVIPPDLRELDRITLDIEYEGILSSAPGSLEKEDIGETVGIISERGVYLSPACLWYPDIPFSLATFTVTSITPIGYESITQGTLVDKKRVNNKTYTTWEEKNVSEGCHLVAGRYAITAIRHNSIDIYAFFFPEDQGLVKTYLDATVRYLDMYQALLGDYPYGKFAIVENFFQTGYGMPSFTLLGSAVVKLPFIVETSLGHEILHNWWGNSVFVDDLQGNWCEGLTSYMADYYYKELKDVGSAIEYRKDLCRKYTNYVTEQNDFSLKKFTGRVDQATQAIGYGKTAMVFHMLRQMVGDEFFYQSLRSFYRDKIWQQASWSDIQRIFEDVGKMDMAWFFEQWINQEGAPFIELGKTEVEKASDSGWTIKVEILQGGKPYRLSIPIHVELVDGNFHTVAEVKEISNVILIRTKSQPVRIAIDPQYDIFRRLHTEEIPPTIDLVLGDSDKIIVYPTGGSSPAAYKELAGLLADNGGVIKADTEITETELVQKSLFILGGPLENKLTKIFLKNLPENFSLEGGIFTVNSTAYNKKDDALLVTFKNPGNTKKGVALFFGLSSNIINNLGSKIPHYGKYSYLVFAEGKNKDKGTFPVINSPLHRNLNW